MISLFCRATDFAIGVDRFADVVCFLRKEQFDSYEVFMAWRSSGTSSASLASALVCNKLLHTEEVISAFQHIDRKWFVPLPLQQFAYEDRPLPIGYSVTISAPHMHAIMAEILAPFVVGRQPKKILDVGSGSGFLTCVLTAMSPLGSEVVGVEHVPELVKSSSAVVRAHFPEWLDSGRLQFIQGDGLSLSNVVLASSAFDAIHVGAAAAEIPEAMVRMLAPGGCLVIPVASSHVDPQELVVVEKKADGSLLRRCHSYVQFVPLTHLAQQLGDASES